MSSKPEHKWRIYFAFNHGDGYKDEIACSGDVSAVNLPAMHEVIDALKRHGTPVGKYVQWYVFTVVPINR